MNLNESRAIMSESVDKTTSISKTVTAAPVKQYDLSGKSTSTAQSQEPSMIVKTGALIVMNGLTQDTYPFLANKTEKFKYCLAELSTLWADPITYGRQSDPFGASFAIQSWFPPSHD